MDTQCSGCAGGQFSDVVSKASCEPHTQCVPGAGAVSKTMQVRREEETEGGGGCYVYYGHECVLCRTVAFVL